MSTEIQKMGFSEMSQMGKVFAESGMFVDAKSAAQAIVKIQAGQEIGISPFSSMSGIHIIQGKPAIGAGLMAATVKGSGKYDYKVVSMDEAKCSIDFYQGKEKIGNSTFTMDEAKKAGTKNLDKYPKNMLFARAMSNGVKWFTPDVFNGSVYTPEEMGANITEDGTPIFTEKAPQGSGQKPDSIAQPPAKKKLTEAKYKQALEGVKTGATLPNSEVSFFTFLTTECELTTEQLIEVNAAYAI
jgi:hypothetical protein